MPWPTTAAAAWLFISLRTTGDLIAGPPQIIAFQGQGPHQEQQEGSHAHWVGFSPDQRWLLAVDLGSDVIWRLPFDSGNYTLSAGEIAYRAPPGTGPRHLASDPNGSRA